MKTLIKSFMFLVKDLIILAIFIAGVSCSSADNEHDISSDFSISFAKVGTRYLVPDRMNDNVPYGTAIIVNFSMTPDTADLESKILLTKNNILIPLVFKYLDEGKSVSINPKEILLPNTSYLLEIRDLRGPANQQIESENYFFQTEKQAIQLLNLTIDEVSFSEKSYIWGVSQLPVVKLEFSEKLSPEIVNNLFSLISGKDTLELNVLNSDDTESVFELSAKRSLSFMTKYSIHVNDGTFNEASFKLDQIAKYFFTRIDPVPKYPVIDDDELLSLIQEQSFKYFWDFAHPVSGLILERNTSGDLVTIGGTGFGLMAIIVGIKNNYISLEEGIQRIRKMVDFLFKADRFHGVWPHWLSGTTGETIPFSSKDDGGDLVETSYLAMGLITLREYLMIRLPGEMDLINDINQLLESIEWNWYTQGENSLTWHWSPNFGFEKNHKIRGWNEALITYIMAASSKNYGIVKEVYTSGWTRNGGMINGKDFLGFNLPLGPDFGGPLFFSHYSFLGLDPFRLEDEFCNYGFQVKQHSLINHAYCVDNPLDYVEYSDNCWGLTASDGNLGYSAHSPTRDRGVITPTAAISSIPFTPEISLQAIRFFYYNLGDKLWGPMGFYDAFNLTENWYAKSYLAIDQGPIIIMIENYKTGLMWNLFMNAPEIKYSLEKLNFKSY
jgi:hypothetical protein